MMTDIERRKVFWLLKKYTSFTAWKARAKAFNEFADAWIAAMRQADAADIDAFNKNATKRILEGRIALEKGLSLLKRGHRSVWRMSEDKSFAAWGYLAQASEAFAFARRIMDQQEYVFDWMKNRGLVFERYESLKFWVTGSGVANERKNRFEAAPLNPSNALAVVHPVYGVPLLDRRYLNFPRHLPEVPPPQNTIVFTGEAVPLDGIYEPEWSARQSNVGSAPTDSCAVQVATHHGRDRVAVDDKWKARNVGCMNYLLSHTAAPTYRDNESSPPMPVTWRLIWKDERYLNGVIPEEEEEYLLPIEEPATEKMRCDAGQPCPRAGYWFTPAKAGSRHYFQSGEIMPLYESPYGLTIWQWDESQNA